MEEKKNRFFDFDVQTSLNEENIKSETVEEKETNNVFSEVFGNVSEVETLDVEEQKVKTFEEVFNTELKEEVNVEQEKEIINSSQFFNTEVEAVEEIEITPEEETYVEKIGDNPMVDYERINSQVEENVSKEEIVEELPKEDPAQVNNTFNRKTYISNSDLMKLRMQRR